MAGDSLNYKISINTGDAIDGMKKLASASDAAAESTFAVAGAQDAVAETSKDAKRGLDQSSESYKQNNSVTRIAVQHLAAQATAQSKAEAGNRRLRVALGEVQSNSKRASEAYKIQSLQLQSVTSSSQKASKSNEALGESSKHTAEQTKVLESTFKATTQALDNMGKVSATQNFNVTLPNAQDLKVNELKGYVTEVGKLVNNLTKLGKVAEEAVASLQKFHGAISGVGFQAQTAPVAKGFERIADSISEADDSLDDYRDSSQEAKQATQALDQQIKSSGNAFDVIDRKIQSATSEIEQFGNQMEKAAESQRQLSGMAQTFMGILAAQAATAITGNVWESAKEYQSLQNQLTLTAKAGENVKTIMDELFVVAESSRQPIAAVSDTYKTFKENTKALGLEQSELLNITELAAKAISIGGSTADQAKNSMVQFGQALSVGKLSGQNFNSVAEQTPGLVQAIAKGLKMGNAELKEYANQGKLTTEVIVQALNQAKGQIESDYATMTVTVEQALTGLQNKLTKLIGENDFFSEKLASAVAFIADHLEALAYGIGLAAAAVIGFKATQFASHLGEVGAGIRATITANGGLIASLKAAGSSFTMAGIQAKLASAGVTVWNTVVGVAGTVWRTFDMIVRSSLIGAIITGLVYGVQLLIDKLSGATDGVNELSQAGANLSLDDQIAQINLQVDKTNEKLRRTNQALKNLEEKKNMGPMSTTYYSARKTELEKNAQEARNELIRLGQQLDELEHKKSVLYLELTKQNTPETPELPEIKAPKIGGGAKTDYFKQNLDSLSKSLLALEFDFKHLSDTGTSVMSKLDEVNKNLATQAQGYTNLTEKQIEALRTKAIAIDQVTAKLNLQKQQSDLQAEYDFESQKLELLQQGLDLQDEKLRRLQWEYEQRAQLLALSDLEKQALWDQKMELEEIQARSSELIVQREEDSNAAKESFIARLEEMKPSVATFKNFAVSAFDKIGDAIGEAAVGGKVSFSDMARQIVKDFIKMTIKALAMGLMIKAIDSMTQGVFGATMKVAAAKAEKGQDPGPAGGVASGIAKMFNIGKGFMSGGFTGNYGTNQPAGIVHGQEFVFNARQTRRLGLSNLEALHNGANFEDLAKQQDNQVVGGISVLNSVIINNTVSNAKVDVQEKKEGLFITVKQAEDIADSRFWHNMAEYQENKS